MAEESARTGDGRRRAMEIARIAGGFLSAGDFTDRGVNRVMLRQLVAEGLLSSPARGVYVSSDLYQSMSHLREWALVAYRYPETVFCLQTAAVFHGLTGENPAELHVFSPRSYGERLRMGAPFCLPVHALVTRNDDNLAVGVDVHQIDGVAVRMTSPERTLVDMFRFSPLGGGGRGSDLVTQEMFLTSLGLAAQDDTRFDFDEVAMHASAFGCYDGLSPLVKTARFQVQSASY